MKERNDEICRRYTEGRTIAELRLDFSLSHMTIRNLLRKAGVYRPYRDNTRADDDREAFLGVNLTEASKDALRAKAEEEGVSMSRLVSNAVDEMVK